MPCHAGPPGEAPGTVRSQREQDKSFYCGKAWVRQDKQAKQVQDVLV